MKEKKYLIYGICLSLLIVIGVTLAYFITEIEGDKKDVTLNTGDLRVIFNNGEKIEGIDIEPGWSITKTFSIENKSKTEYKYNIVIQDLVNTFVSDNLVYKITSTNNGHNMTDYEVLPKSETAEDTLLTYSTTISGKTTQEYTIEVKFKEEDRNQYEDMGKTITGKIYITKGTKNSTFLTQAILRDNPTISERTDFLNVNIENTTGTIYKTNKTEDGSYVYYYSGNTTNNWIKFGKYETDRFMSTNCYNSFRCEGNSLNECYAAGGIACYSAWNIGDDIYWRIIRTNEDESIRLLYFGTKMNVNNRSVISTSEYNINNSDPMYVGYMYGTSGSLENNRTNRNDSTVKTYIDTWYQNNLLTNYDKYISKSAIYCNDRSVPDNNYSISSEFIYGSALRVAVGAPSYKCGANTSDGLFESTQAVADKFSASTEGGGNGQLKYPIALMTGDEMAFAGGYNGSKKSDDPYPWHISNRDGKWRYIPFYSLSPGTNSQLVFMGANLPPASIEFDADIGSFNSISGEEFGVVPVISLSSCVKVTGTGTADDPYVVDEEGSTC